MPEYPMTMTKPRPLAPPGAPPSVFGRATNLGGIPQPVQPGQDQAPNLPASPNVPGFEFAPPSLGPAPTATPFGDFQAPSLPGGMDPYQWRVDQANKGAERSAARRGTLLSGGFQTALAKLNQGLASEEADNIYRRARDTYGLNRETNAQNFGQSLAGYQAGTGATLDSARLGLAGATAGYDRTYGAARDRFGDERDAAMQQTGVINANQQATDAYAQMMEDYRAQLERQRMDQEQASAPRPLPARRMPLPGVRTHLG